MLGVTPVAIDYTPVPSVVPFLLSEKFQSFIVGAVGSTKTTASLMKIVMQAKKIAACTDGIRRSRTAVVRNTRQQLQDSTLSDFLRLFPEGQAGVYIRTEMKFIMRFDDVECEVLFRGLDDSSDVRRLLSLQLTNAMVDEVREINADVFNALTGRVGRYPNGMMVPNRPEWGRDEKGNFIQGCVDDNGQQMKKVWGATNPADMDTFWETYLSSANPEKTHVSIQPSGLSPEADWIQHLPANYYEDLMEGKSQEWIDVYIHGRWGTSLSGRPVFPTFDVAYHIAKETLKPFVQLTNPLIVSMDYGLTPACVVSQLDPRGRFLVFAELVSENMGITRFLREKLRPLLATRFPGHPVLIVGDPAGKQRAQTDERSVFDVIKAEGFRAIPAKTNALAARLSAVETLLGQQVDGGPRLLIDPGCKELIRGFRGGYRFKLKRDGEMLPAPEKNESSHLHDSLQYGCLHVDATFGSVVKERKRRELKLQHASGWT